ncbi:MAG TPA: hypothetical protein VHV55_00090 [Pirellulales bacterium]|jgi:hypothetical protein|nr:hypothetical protein [Pirellulales bacterium]
MLEREEYIEQAYFFRALNERMRQNMATQDLLVALRDEVLSTTKLTMALDFLASELKLSGGFAPAMQRLAHYFTAFQTFVIGEAESEQGRFDFRVALEILERDARYRADGASPQGMFLFQFESLCRNRLGYDRGLEAISRDPMFDEAWKEWTLMVRRQVGLVDFADLIYVRSQHYVNQRRRQQLDLDGPEKPVLFGEKEGKIAFANRQKDPLWLFAALERHLNYPTVPKPQPVDEAKNLLPGMIRRLERVESRLKLLEEEQKGGIDLARFYQPPSGE